MKKLFESELRVMMPLWDFGPQTAGEIVKKMNQSYGWNKNTTYTIIKRLIEKGTIARSGANFVCTPLISRKEVQKSEIENLITRLFGGSKFQFISAFICEDGLTNDEAIQLRDLIDSLK